jgi:hypothetical protein
VICIIRQAARLLTLLSLFYATERRNITDEKQALDEVLSVLETEGLSGNKKFLSGTDEPHLGDLAVFGTLRSIEGLPAHAQAVQDRGGVIPEWYAQMNAKMQQK